jgi:hypothetical protein
VHFRDPDEMSPSVGPSPRRVHVGPSFSKRVNLMQASHRDCFVASAFALRAMRRDSVGS